MITRIFVAAVVTAGWVGACSRPVADQAGSAEARQIRLAEPATPDSAVVSDLEAPQALKPVLVRRVTSPVPRSAPAEPVHDHVAAVAADVPHVMSSMERSAEPVVELPGLVAAPSAPVGTAPALIVGTQAVAASVPGDYRPSVPTLGGSRGPMILIRGGMGGVDDKCDLRGQHRSGIAINRSAPAFGGYPRGGIR